MGDQRKYRNRSYCIGLIALTEEKLGYCQRVLYIRIVQLMHHADPQLWLNAVEQIEQGKSSVWAAWAASIIELFSRLVATNSNLRKEWRELCPEGEDDFRLDELTEALSAMAGDYESENNNNEEDDDDVDDDDDENRVNSPYYNRDDDGDEYDDGEDERGWGGRGFEEDERDNVHHNYQGGYSAAGLQGFGLIGPSGLQQSRFQRRLAPPPAPSASTVVRDGALELGNGGGGGGGGALRQQDVVDIPAAGSGGDEEDEVVAEIELGDESNGEEEGEEEEDGEGEDK